MSKNNSFLYSLVILFFINAVLLFMIHLNWNNSMKFFFPLEKELLTVRNDVTEAHLWFEEYLSGDTTIDVYADILTPFEHKDFERYINSLKDAHFTDKKFILENFKTLDIHLDELYSLALGRLEESKTSGIGTQKDQEFDRKFKFCMAFINTATFKVNKALQNEIKAKDIYFEYVFIFFIITNIIIFIMMLMIRDRNNKQDEMIFEQTKMASMGEMIGNIAHQWRQPLSVISTGVTGMQVEKEYGMLDDEQFEKTCTSIYQNAIYLSKTIDDFRNYIKGDSVKEKFSINDEIDTFLTLVDATIKFYDLHIVLDVQKNIQIDGYKNELLQVLINLFNNAKDAFLENEKIEDRYVFLSVKAKKDILELTIKDNAGGISKDIEKKIFEPYFTTKHKSQGTGLGLYMTYNLIQKSMNGSISVDTLEYFHNDIKYKGAQFTIYLPL